MLKRFGYAGMYRDSDMSVDVILETPLNYGLDATTLVFSVMVLPKGAKTGKLRLEDFTFYIMDETNRMYNVQTAAYSDFCITGIVDDEETPHLLKGLILSDFKYEFLYQDIRVAFCYQPYNRIEIITLEH